VLVSSAGNALAIFFLITVFIRFPLGGKTFSRTMFVPFAHLSAISCPSICAPKLSCVRLSVALFMLELLDCTTLLSGDYSFRLRKGCRFKFCFLLFRFCFHLCWTLTRWSMLIDLRDVTRAGLLSLGRLLLLAWLLPWLILILLSYR
jgi:hypothetical protein